MSAQPVSLLPPEIPPPTSVVSLVPSVTESLFDLNLGERVIGRTDYCVYPVGQVDRVPKVGGTRNPDVSQIIRLNPDLVIVNQEENRREDVEALKDAGIHVWVTFPKLVSDVFNLLWNMMELFDETSMVPRVRLIEYTYDWVRGMSADSDSPRVFVPIWYDPIMTAGGDTYLSNLLRVCGGENVFADPMYNQQLVSDAGTGNESEDVCVAETGQRYPVVSLEDVEQAQPEIILLPNEPYQFAEVHVRLFEQLEVPAARNGRIHLIDGSLLTWHGTRIAYAFETIPALLRLLRG